MKDFKIVAKEAKSFVKKCFIENAEEKKESGKHLCNGIFIYTEWTDDGYMYVSMYDHQTRVSMNCCKSGDIGDLKRMNKRIDVEVSLFYDRYIDNCLKNGESVFLPRETSIWSKKENGLFKWYVVKEGKIVFMYKIELLKYLWELAEKSDYFWLKETVIND